VITRSRRQAGRDKVRSRFDISMSSISGCSGKPPIASNAARVMNRAWSPVAMPLQRERTFMQAATTRSIRGRPAMRTSKRPQTC
jgi:hypothetical protein